MGLSVVNSQIDEPDGVPSPSGAKPGKVDEDWERVAKWCSAKRPLLLDIGCGPKSGLGVVQLDGVERLRVERRLGPVATTHE